jgi:type II secretion system protein C
VAEARATTRKEWALAILGGLALSAMLVLWLRPPSAPVAPQQMAPPPAPPPAPPVAQSTQTTSPPGLKLRGILARGGGGSAILEDEGGGQRLVAVGRFAAPGWRLAALSPTSATLEAESGAVHMLQFEAGESGTGTAPLAAPKDLKATPQSLAATSTAYRLALRPVAGETELEGWTVQTPETIPLFRLAGLQPGDTLLAINGQPLFSEEKVLELPSEIAGANAVDVEFRRNGQKATVRVTLVR